MDHQSKAVAIARTHPKYAFYFECGTGKTITMLAICHERPMKTLILCPKSIIHAAWLSDAKHFPSLKIVTPKGANRLERQQTISAPWDVLILNYELFKIHYDDLLDCRVERLICDESSVLKNHSTAVTKKVLNFARDLKETYLLSGTPAPNNELEYWPQLRCIAPERINKNYWGFASEFFIPLRRKFGRREFISSWKLKPSYQTKFMDLFKDRAWFLTKEQCLDLPEKIDINRYVELSGHEMNTYNKIFDELKAEIGNGTITINAMAKFLKLRQVTGGMIYHEGKSHNIGEAKLNELEALIKEITLPVVIWAEFTADLDRIFLKLNSQYRCAILDGRTSEFEKLYAINNLGETVDILICHPKAVGHGITLVKASYAIYYSLGYSYENYVQSKDRIHRIGQTNHCTYIHLLAQDTCDEAVLEAIKLKQSVVEIMKASINA